MLFGKFRRWRFLKLALLMGCFFMVLMMYLNSGLLYHSAKSFVDDVTEKCQKGYLNKFVENLCMNYTTGIVFGDLCSPLCHRNQIIFKSCIMHGTTLVLQGEWNGKHIVVKRKKGHKSPMLEELGKGLLRHGMALDSKRLKRDVKETLFGAVQSLLGFATVNTFSDKEKEAIVQALLFRKKLDDVSRMTRNELLSHVQIVAQDEYVMFSVFQSTKYFPRIIGTCGALYGMEKLTPLNKMNLNALPWTSRAKIGQSFLDLFRDFEKTRVGPLSHCDIQEANFGVSDKFEVKAIDVDLIFSKERMNQILPEPACKTSKDCDFFDCISHCDEATKKCTNRSISNNLQVLCKDIFLRHEMEPGLLENPPSYLYQKLNFYLKDCASKYFGLLPMKSKKVLNTIKELSRLLSQSI